MTDQQAELLRVQEEERRVQEETRRFQAESRLLEAWFAFSDVLIADPYLTAERKVDMLTKMHDALPTAEEYATAVWQPGLEDECDEVVYANPHLMLVGSLLHIPLDASKLESR